MHYLTAIRVVDLCRVLDLQSKALVCLNQLIIQTEILLNTLQVSSLQAFAHFACVRKAFGPIDKYTFQHTRFTANCHKIHAQLGEEGGSFYVYVKLVSLRDKICETSLQYLRNQSDISAGETIIKHSAGQEINCCPILSSTWLYGRRHFRQQLFQKCHMNTVDEYSKRHQKVKNYCQIHAEGRH